MPLDPSAKSEIKKYLDDVFRNEKSLRSALQLKVEGNVRRVAMRYTAAATALWTLLGAAIWLHLHNTVMSTAEGTAEAKVAPITDQLDSLDQKIQATETNSAIALKVVQAKADTASIATERVRAAADDLDRQIALLAARVERLNRISKLAENANHVFEQIKAESQSTLKEILMTDSGKKLFKDLIVEAIEDRTFSTFRVDKLTVDSRATVNSLLARTDVSVQTTNGGHRALLTPRAIELLNSNKQLVTMRADGVNNTVAARNADGSESVALNFDTHTGLRRIVFGDGQYFGVRNGESVSTGLSFR